MLLWALACATEEEPTPVATPEPEPEPSACDEQPAVTWEGWGRGFFATWCWSCHSTTTPDRRGAPEGLDFDSWARVSGQRDAIRASVIDGARMPVGGGLAESDLLLLDALLACGTGGDEEPDAPTTPPPTLDAAGVAERAQTLIDGGLPLATDFWDAYRAILDAHADEGCPRAPLNETYALQASMEGCTTGDGWTLYGLTLRESEREGDVWSEWMLGDGSGESPEGLALVFGGEIEWGATQSRGTWWQTVDGTWGWEGGDGWLAGLPSVALAVTVEGPTGTVAGGWTSGDASIYLEDLVLPVSGGAPTAGALWVRDPAGLWFRVPFSGDGRSCGEATYADGSTVGEVCVDFGPMAAALAGGAP